MNSRQWNKYYFFLDDLNMYVCILRLYSPNGAQVDDSNFDIDACLDKYKWIDTNSENYKTSQREIFAYLDGAALGMFFQTCYNFSDITVYVYCTHVRILNLASEKQKFDSRTYTRPKKRNVRPVIPDAMLRGIDNVYNLSGTKTITKHSKNRLMKINSDIYENRENSLFDSESSDKSAGFCEDDFDVCLPNRLLSRNDTFNIETNNVGFFTWTT